MAHVIGIDIGTQSLKGVLLDPNGSVVGQAAGVYEASYPRSGWAEQDTGVWLRAFRDVISLLCDKGGIVPSDIGTIGFASQVDGIVPVDEAGRALAPAIIWLDRRAISQCDSMSSRIPPDRIFDITGLNADSTHVAPKMMWFRDEEPAIVARTAAMLVPGSFMVNRLTGEKLIDESNASSTLLFDVRRRSWSPEMEQATGLEARRLGRLVSSTEVAGYVSREAAAEFGLSLTTKVIAGCGDEHGACIGAGLVAPDLVCDITGTAEPVVATTEAPVFDSSRLVETHVHADTRWWLIENPGFVSGGSVRWSIDLIAGQSAAKPTRLAEQAPPGSKGLIFLPCLSGALTPKWNAHARGTFFGLTLTHGPQDVARAVFEGCTYGFRDIVDRFTSMGVNFDEIRVVGGGASSSFWCQMKADVSGLVVRPLKHKDATAIGAAILASVAEGTFRDIDQAAEKLVRLGTTYEPRSQFKEIYDEGYQLYRKLFATLEPLFDSFALTSKQ